MSERLPIIVIVGGGFAGLSAAKALRRARAALRRTQEGSFRICQECDNDIAPMRLLAVPWAQFCIRRQEAVDRSLEEIQAPSGDLLGRAA